MKKEKYIEAEIDLIRFASKDIIMTSQNVDAGSETGDEYDE